MWKKFFHPCKDNDMIYNIRSDLMETICMKSAITGRDENGEIFH